MIASERTAWAEGLGLTAEQIEALTLISEESARRDAAEGVHVELDPRDVWSAWTVALDDAGRGQLADRVRALEGATRMVALRDRDRRGAVVSLCVADALDRLPPGAELRLRARHGRYFAAVFVRGRAESASVATTAEEAILTVLASLTEEAAS